MKDTDSLNLLGHLLTNETSRKMMALLSEEEMYANQIAKKLNIEQSLVHHYLEKLEKVNLLITIKKEITSKGSKHRYYRIIPNTFITISKTEKEIHETGFLKRIFKDSVKFASIGIIWIFSWFSFESILKPDNETLHFHFSEDGIPIMDLPLIIPIIISNLIIFLLVMVILKKRKKG